MKRGLQLVQANLLVHLAQGLAGQIISLFRILAQQKYDGFLGLDLGAKDDHQLEDWLIRSREYAVRMAALAGTELEW